MNTTEKEVINTKDDIQYNEMQVRVVRKAIQLLSEDLFENVVDPHNQSYFNERVTYLYLVSAAGDNSLLATRFLRTLHSTFNNYYQSYQSPLPGAEITRTDRERHFLYSEINNLLEDFLCNY